MPASYTGKVIYEGELGIVIGKRTARVSEVDAPAHIFGYTCINDVTAVELLKKDATFDQWSRSKSFDTFGVFGPGDRDGARPRDSRHPHHTYRPGTAELSVADMFFRPQSWSRSSRRTSPSRPAT